MPPSATGAGLAPEVISSGGYPTERLNDWEPVWCVPVSVAVTIAVKDPLAEGAPPSAPLVGPIDMPPGRPLAVHV